MSSGKDDSSSPFSSLSYQILLVFGWYYVLLYVVIETLLLFFKRFYYLYPLGNFMSELALLIFLLGIESVRIFLASMFQIMTGNPYNLTTKYWLYSKLKGKKGNLTERPLSIILSLLLTVPVSCGLVYFLWYQTYVLMIDVVMSIISVVFIGLQTLFSVFTLINFGR